MDILQTEQTQPGCEYADEGKRRVSADWKQDGSCSMLAYLGRDQPHAESKQ